MPTQEELERLREAFGAELDHIFAPDPRRQESLAAIEAEVAKLTERAKALRQVRQKVEMHQRAERAEQENAALRAELAEARAAFAAYGDHRPGCRPLDGERCFCGFRENQAALLAESAPPSTAAQS